MHEIEYGLLCRQEDEKKLVKNVNAFLAAKGFRKMYKWKDKGGIRNPEDPENSPQFAHTYVQFLKTPPRWYFDLCPNVDLRGIPRFPNNLDCGWTLYFSKTHHELNPADDDKHLDEFLLELLVGAEFSYVLLHTYADGEYRR